MILKIDDKCIEDYVKDRCLHLQKLIKDDLSERKCVMLSDIKTVDKLFIRYLKKPELLLTLKNCDFEIIDIDNTNIKQLKVTDTPDNIRHFGNLVISESDIKRIEITQSALKIVDIKECEKTNITIQTNTSLEEFELYDTEVSMLTLRSQNNLKNISLIGDKTIEKLYLDRIKSNPEKSSFYSDVLLKNIAVSKCQIYCDVKLDSEILEDAELNNKSTFKSLTINHKKANIKIDDCEIKEKLTIGNMDDKAISSKFKITNNTIGKGISFVNHHIKEEFKIEGNRLENGRWEFYGFSLDENCKSEITKQSFKDATFQNCDFSNFDFQDTDIHLAEIIGPTWNEVDDFTYLGRCSKKDNLSKLQRTICWLLRFFNLSILDNQKRISFERDSEFHKEKDIEKLKKQYSYFRKKFENENSYEISSKFKISEALTRIKLLRAKKSSRRHLLKISKCLNLFSESIFRPAIWFILVLFSFTILYLFSGFKIKNGDASFVPIDYSFNNFDIDKIFSRDFSDFENYWHAFVFSLKNIVPIKLESNFYLSADSEFRWTQLLSMLQKLINIIILGALIASMRNFFRK